MLGIVGVAMIVFASYGIWRMLKAGKPKEEPVQEYEIDKILEKIRKERE